MLSRVLTIAMNTYREAVRARILHGLFAIAIATSLYAIVVANTSAHQETRAIADVGAASISLYAVLVAIVISATSLHREVELKTIFPVLSRPLRRHEYLIGKYVGTLLTLGVFVAVDAAVVLFILAAQTPARIPALSVSAPVLLLVLALLVWRASRVRVFVLMPWAMLALAVAFVLAAPAGSDRQLVVASAALTMFEVGIIAAVATFFASFSSPFLTTIFTLGVFIAGRSADTLAHLPPQVFGQSIASFFKGLSRVAPNLHLYVPARPLLLGQVADAPVGSYVAMAGAHALAYATVLLVLSALIFRKRDFQ